MSDDAGSDGPPLSEHPFAQPDQEQDKSPPSPVTPEWIADQVERIDTSDPERAHAAEDALWETVLKAIERRDCEDVSACAFAALQTRQLTFSRWSA